MDQLINISLCHQFLMGKAASLLHNLWCLILLFQLVSTLMKFIFTWQLYYLKNHLLWAHIHQLRNVWPIFRLRDNYLLLLMFLNNLQEWMNKVV
jgi:hypothetical protein